MAREIDLPKLWTSMQHSLRATEKFQTNFLEHVREFVSSNYADNSDPKYQSPVNLISQYINIVPRQLVGADPRFMGSTFDRDLRTLVSSFEEWGNRKLRKIRFTDILQRAVLDSIFLIGIVKTSITAPSEVRFGGYTKKVGEPGIVNINYEDFCFDAQANKFEECDYVGHQYWVPTEYVSKSKLFSKKARLKVVPDHDEPNDQRGNERLSTLSRGGLVDQEEFVDRSRLWEMYIPSEGKVITFWDGNTEDILFEQPWIGPDCGPFEYLALGEWVPGNLLPKSPIMDLIDLHREHNMLWKKIANQAKEQKTVILYRNTEDATKHEKASDNQYVQTQDPEGMKEVSTGGPNNMVATHVMANGKAFDRQAGNLAALGGLDNQADTATQEKLIVGNASKQIQGMSHRVVSFAQRLITNIGWFWWKDPYTTMKSTYTVPGLPDISAQRSLPPDQRRMYDYNDIDMRIDPYSLHYSTPQQKVQILDQMMQQVFIPLMPLFHQPGTSDLLQEYVKLKAKWVNEPELIVLLEKMLGVAGMVQPGQQPMPNPLQPNSPTENTRINRRETSDEGQNQILQQLMAAGQTNQGEGMESLMTG